MPGWRERWSGTTGPGGLRVRSGTCSECESSGLVVSSCGYVDMKMCGYVDMLIRGYVDVWICNCTQPVGRRHPPQARQVPNVVHAGCMQALVGAEFMLMGGRTSGWAARVRRGDAGKGWTRAYKGSCVHVPGWRERWSCTTGAGRLRVVAAWLGAASCASTATRSAINSSIAW